MAVSCVKVRVVNFLRRLLCIVRKRPVQAYRRRGCFNLSSATNASNSGRSISVRRFRWICDAAAKERERDRERQPHEKRMQFNLIDVDRVNEENGCKPLSMLRACKQSIKYYTKQGRNSQMAVSVFPIHTLIEIKLTNLS